MSVVTLALLVCVAASVGERSREPCELVQEVAEAEAAVEAAEEPAAVPAEVLAEVPAEAAAEAAEVPVAYATLSDFLPSRRGRGRGIAWSVAVAPGSRDGRLGNVTSCPGTPPEVANTAQPTPPADATTATRRRSTSPAAQPPPPTTSRLAGSLLNAATVTGRKSRPPT